MTHQPEEMIDNPFIGGDPLTKIVREKLNIDIIFATIGIVLLLNVPSTIVIIRDNLWNSTVSKPGVTNDAGFWILNLLAFPATVLFFLWMPDGVWNVLTGLRANGAIREDGILKQYLKDFCNFYKHWIWAILCFLVILALNIFVFLPINRTLDLWWTTGTFIFWYQVLIFAFYGFLVALIVVRILIAILWFNRLFRWYEIQVKILYPDKAGGLSPLGGFSVKIGYLIGVYGLTLVITIMSEKFIASGQIGPTLNPAAILAVFLYFVLAPIAFFAPIGSAHSAMGKAKDEFALQISERFDDEFLNLQASLVENPEQIKSSMENIKQLQEMHAIATRFPVWPFSTENLVRFFTSILSPILIIIISAIIDLLFQ